MTAQPKARRSQLVSTYGIGGLFPSDNTSYMIAGQEEWNEERCPQVSEPRLARSLAVGRLLMPPAGGNRDVPVIRFPYYQVCPNCRRVAGLNEFKSPWNEAKCMLPSCNGRYDLTPSRLVISCPRGHIDEFPYFKWLHQDSGSPNSGDHQMKLQAKGRTSSLADLVLSCTCGVTPTGLDGSFDANAFVGKLTCLGKRPWLGADAREDCDQIPRTLQRGASNVWFPAGRSAISIPPFSEAVAKFVDGEWHLLKEPQALETAFIMAGLVAKSRNRFTAEDISAEARRRYAADNDGTELDDESLRRDEFKALVEGRGEDSAKSDFVCLREDMPESLRSWLGELRMVTRLREVRALYGFSRLTAVSGGPDAMNMCKLSAEKRDWLPAIEVIGEGLFLTLPRGPLKGWSERPFAQSRQRLLQESAERRARAFNQVDPPKVDVVRAAVHTFAHILIDQLSLDAGYPAASLRERLFVDDTMAGILVYTASSDSAGSLGGVASQAHPDRFEHAVKEGLQRLAWCSSDPVCIESRASGVDGLNLAACHACVLVPETSCELNNTFLDRGLLFGTHKPGERDGIFQDLLAELSVSQ